MPGPANLLQINTVHLFFTCAKLQENIRHLCWNRAAYLLHFQLKSWKEHQNSITQNNY